MADPTLNLNHISEALARLLTQFQGQPAMAKTLESYLVQVQELEGVIYSLMADRYIDSAVGAQLDGIGTVVGEPRAGRTDIDYRIAIKGRIRSNRASSRVEDILALFVLLLPTSTFVLTQDPAAAFVIQVSQALGGSAPSPDVMDAQLQRAKGGGVRAHLHYGLVEPAERFTYASGDVLVSSTTQGYGDDTPQTTGGRYTDLFS
jgi:hypothetical protein